MHGVSSRRFPFSSPRAREDVPSSFLLPSSICFLFRKYDHWFTRQYRNSESRYVILLHYKNKYPTRLEERRNETGWKLDDSLSPSLSLALSISISLFRRIKVKYIPDRKHFARVLPNPLFSVRAIIRRRESHWQVQLVAVMPAADVLLQFLYIYNIYIHAHTHTYIVELSLSLSGIYRLTLPASLAHYPFTPLSITAVTCEF